MIIWLDVKFEEAMWIRMRTRKLSKYGGRQIAPSNIPTAAHRWRAPETRGAPLRTGNTWHCYQKIEAHQYEQ
jgi:hypothetical protein